MSTLAFYAQFVTNKVGVNGLTVTWDVEQITRSDGTRAALVTGGATTITIGRRGLYGYLLSGADTKLYDYIATAITATTTVDQQEVAALWTVYEADVVKMAGTATVAGAIPAVAAGASGGLPVLDANLVSAANVTLWKGATAPAMTGDAYARLGAPAGASVSADIAAIAADVAAIDNSGTYSYSNTVDDGSGNLLDGVYIQLSTNSGFTNIVTTTHSNASGAFTVRSDQAGTHYLRLQLAGYSFTDQTVTLA